MAILNLPAEKGNLSVEIADDLLGEVLMPRKVAADVDPGKEIRRALSNPVESKRLGEIVPHRSTRGHLFRLLRELENAEPGGMTGISRSLHDMAERIHRRGLVVLVSDLIDEPEEVISGLRHFRHRGHELVVFHILDDLELSLDYGGEVTFVDRETGERLRAQPWFLRRDYRRSVGEWTSWLEKRCVENAIDYNLITTSTPFDEALVSYLGKRARMG